MNRYRRSVIVIILNLGLTAVILVGLGLSPRPAYAQGDEAGWLLGQINGLRQQHGLPPLTVNSHLTVSATLHSNYLATHPYTDPHVEADGSTPHDRIAAAGYAGRLVGENVVGGEMATVTWAFQWWVNEPIHYKNMLASWTEIGIGIASGPYGHWYTTDFGIGAGDAPAQPVAPPPATAAPNSSSPGDDVSQVPPPPTRRPATRVPTLTPSLTLTPSITFTARPTFTPTSTATDRPPTGTAIVLEISPQPSGTQLAAAAQFVAAIVSPTASPLPEAAAEPPIPATDAGDGLRRLIPWAIGLQAAIILGFVFRSILRRGSN